MNSVRIALVWENFGPSHYDRIGACVGSGLAVTAIQFNAKSQTYLWEEGQAQDADCATLAAPAELINPLVTFWRLCLPLHNSRAEAFFLCDYQRLSVFFAALVMRLSGRPVYMMLCSKFDDYPRFWWRELAKRVLLSPYKGAIVGNDRSIAYLLLGFRRRPMLCGYNSLSVARIQHEAVEAGQVAHAERDFLIVARLVPKNNLPFALCAFADWQRRAFHPRKLQIIGYGEEESGLRSLTAELGVADVMVYEGEQDSAAVYRAMPRALCLILPSREKQFGQVVIKALSLSLPVLLSSNAGATDLLLDNGVNGWLIDPYRPAALVAAMALLDCDEAAWKAASTAALARPG